MTVTPTGKNQKGVPDYYNLYVVWTRMAAVNPVRENYCLVEAMRFARLAEEFGQAVIKDEDTLDDAF